ncbi:hypothetical protein GIB67_036324 [Kingdonia uniflora]|uniref:ATP-dependent DNA ligase family profile domain-containing protein n=1 Tax=Kingdonia uniflora TaxID=39325 RepID=A0A7J7L3W3_9MAGN|nr:hypothetical protein GIB67_036324 [Kingdonia uniflora]
MGIGTLVSAIKDISQPTYFQSSLFQNNNYHIRASSKVADCLGCKKARFKVRNLRIGAMMKTVLPALAQAVVTNSSPCLPHEGASKFLKEKLQCVSAAVVEAHTILPNLDILVPSLVSKGIDFTSETLSMVPGIPIMPMLARSAHNHTLSTFVEFAPPLYHNVLAYSYFARITNGVSQILKLFEGRAFTCEYKYDGQRAQIHKLNDGSVRVFSRKGDDMTSKFPDLVKIIKESCKTATVTFVVDAEVVAVDRKRCKLMSFQELSSRERGTKSSIITVDDIEVDICVFVFDVMFANGDK